MQKRQFTEEEYNAIFNSPYKSSTEIYLKYNIPASTVRRLRNNFGIYTKSKLSYVSEEEFVEKYKELKSSQEMAEYYNVDHHTIEKYCEKIGFDSSEYKKE